MADQRIRSSRARTVDRKIVESVIFSTPERWGKTSAEILYAQSLIEVAKRTSVPLYLLAWPNGVRATLSSPYDIGSVELGEAIATMFRVVVADALGQALIAMGEPA